MIKKLVEFGALVPVHIQFGELDVFGALLHTQYLRLVAGAATTYWESKGYYDFGKPISPDAYTAVQETTATYDQPIRPQPRRTKLHAPIGEFSPVAVHLWIEQIRATSYTMGFRVVSSQNTEQYAHGSRVDVKLDPRTMLPTPWSEAALSDLNELLRPTL